MDERDFEIELRGYNKEEVNMYINELEAEYKQKLGRLEAKSREADKQIDDLSRRIEKKERQKEELEQEIETKYKTYIDHYDKIAGLVYEAQLKADKILEEANLRAGEILADAHVKEQQILSQAQTVLDEAKAQEKMILDDADAEAKRRVEAVQDTVETGMADGRTRFADIRVQIRGMIDLLEEAQSRFAKGCADAHSVFDAMPEDIGQYGDGEFFDEDDPDDADFNEIDPETL
ncbi:MAG: hypothetical protein IJJ50_08355 [Lachnospiraceae bacterium]|nr:hypothetical protein [Lachnospiraceae bacterium]